MIQLAGFLLLVSFGYVFLKAMQQKNVVGGHYLLIGPISYGMAFCEVYGITAYVNSPDQKWIAAAAIGTGAWLGCILAMYSHDRVFKRVIQGGGA